MFRRLQCITKITVGIAHVGRFNMSHFLLLLFFAVSPSIIRNQTRQERFQGQNVTFSIHLGEPVFPVPTASQYTWRSPDGSVIMSGSKYTLAADSLSLVVDDVQRMDAGNYSVSVFNDGGADTAEVSLEVYGMLQCNECYFAAFFGSLHVSTVLSLLSLMLVANTCNLELQ